LPRLPAVEGLAADRLSSFPSMKRSKNLGCTASFGLLRQSGSGPQAEPFRLKKPTLLHPVNNSAKTK